MCWKMLILVAFIHRLEVGKHIDAAKVMSRRKVECSETQHLLAADISIINLKYTVISFGRSLQS